MSSPLLYSLSSDHACSRSDYTSHRDMLGGRTRAIYEGPFGLQVRPPFSLLTSASQFLTQPNPFVSCTPQPQIWRLTETLVLRPPHLSPFPTDSSSPHDFTPSALNAGFPPTWSTALSTADAEVLTGVPGYRLVDEKEEEEMREKWAKGGGVDEGLEIIVTGTGHSAWGRFYVSGRVRVWDGMVLLMKEYYVSLPSLSLSPLPLCNWRGGGERERLT